MQQYVSIPVPNREAVRHWTLRIAFILLSLYVAYVVRDIWLPLGLALILALVLDPVVDRMEAKKWSRTWAAAFIFGSFIVITGGLIILAAPYVASQASQMQAPFEAYFPDHSKAGLLNSFHKMNVPDWAAQIGAQSFETVQGGLKKSSSSIANYGMQFASNLVWIVIIPIVAFYMLRDFHLILAKSLLLVPVKSRSAVQTAVSEITVIFGQYLRGLGIVSLLNGVATCILLEVLRVPSPILLGVIAGILYSVPYIGAVLTVALTAAVSFVGGGIHMMMFAVGASVLLHQVVFDQIISPRILGGHVGLHPILSIIALLCGNLLLGIVGMILAVPVAACIQIAVLAVLPKLAVQVEIPAGAAQTEMATVDREPSESEIPATPTEQMKIVVAAVVDEIEAQVSRPGPTKRRKKANKVAT